ncbi:MAG: hypothetical protein OYH77_07070 [Pseudomonadota bacterium]|nr:hypothetical protein [Pseudomonadota bacterium]
MIKYGVSVIAALLLTTQVYAGGQGIRHTIRTALKDSVLIQRLASAHKVLPTAINSSNVGKFMGSAELASKLRNTLIASGAALVLLAGSAVAEEGPPSRETIESGREDVVVYGEITPTREEQYKLVTSSRLGFSGGFGGATHHAPGQWQAGIFYRGSLMTDTAKMIANLNTMMNINRGENLRQGGVYARAKYIQSWGDGSYDGYSSVSFGVKGELGYSNYDGSAHITDFASTIGVLFWGADYQNSHIFLNAGVGVLEVDDEIPYRNRKSIAAVFGIDIDLPGVSTGAEGGEISYSAFFVDDAYAHKMRYDLLFADLVSLNGEVFYLYDYHDSDRDYLQYQLLANLNLLSLIGIH